MHLENIAFLGLSASIVAFDDFEIDAMGFLSIIFEVIVEGSICYDVFFSFVTAEKQYKAC
jgi:hypothetical protein